MTKLFRTAFFLSICASATTVSAQTDYPTDRDLKAAYCSQMYVSTIESNLLPPAANDSIRKKAGHFNAYLLSRGYGQNKDLLLLIPAQAAGKADEKTYHAAVTQCAAETSGQEETLDALKLGKRMNECLAAKNAIGLKDKIFSCEQAENDLPF